MKWDRAIVHADMNAFFASIEQLDNPALRGRPVGVTNGLTGTCIITSSYEARAEGVKTGMHLNEAEKRCPGFIRCPARPMRYAEISTRIMQAMKQNISPIMEVFSVDEAFLDVTRSQQLLGSPEAICQHTKDAIYNVSGLKSSVGISEGKLTAKWAAKQNKPDGLTVLPADQVRGALADRPVDEICGVARGIREHLARFNAHTCGDVARLPITVLSDRWGCIGRRLWSVCRGHDPDQLELELPAPKSIGHGKVMPPDTRDPDIIRTFLFHMAEKVATRLRKHDFEATRFFIGIRTASGWQSHQYKILSTDDSYILRLMCNDLLKQHWNGAGGFQVQITALNPKTTAYQNDWLRVKSEQRKSLNQAVDIICQKFGEFAVAPAPLTKRSDMPNVITPAWRPTGHRATIEGKQKYVRTAGSRGEIQGVVRVS